jgi:hypothetical protein
MLDLVVITDGTLVYVANFVVVVANAVTGDSLEQDKLCPAPQPGRLVEGQIFRWFQESFSWFKLLAPLRQARGRCLASFLL